MIIKSLFQLCKRNLKLFDARLSYFHKLLVLLFFSFEILNLILKFVDIIFEIIRPLFLLKQIFLVNILLIHYLCYKLFTLLKLCIHDLDVFLILGIFCLNFVYFDIQAKCLLINVIVLTFKLFNFVFLSKNDLFSFNQFLTFLVYHILCLRSKIT